MRNRKKSLRIYILAIALMAIALLTSDKLGIFDSFTGEAAYSSSVQDTGTSVTFRNSKLLNEHYEKHGIDMGFPDAASYEKAASAVVTNPDALHKIEKEDGDDVYYVEATNEFVIVSTDGYIRTYFLPDSGIKYFNKQ